MPRIREYVSQVGGAQELPLAQVTRQAYASDFNGAGVGVSMLGQATQQGAHDLVNAYRLQQEAKAREEVTDAAVELSRFNASAEHELKNAINSGDAEADSYTEEYMARISTNLDQVGAKYQTPAGMQAWARGSEATRSHFLVRAGEAHAHMAGVKAVAQFKDFVASTANAVMNNPYSFDRYEQSMSDVIRDPKGVFAHLPADKREELAFMGKTQLAQSAAQGIIQMDPHLGMALLQQGKWDSYLTPDNKHALMSEARVGIAGLEAGERHRQAEAIRLRKKEVDEINQGFVEKFSNDTLTVEEVLKSNLDAVGDGSKEHWIKSMDAKHKERREAPIKKDPKTFLNVLSGIRDGSITTETQIERVFQESADRHTGITWEDTKQLRQELKDIRTPEGEKLGEVRKSFINQFKASITTSNPVQGKIDKSGDRKLYEYEWMINRKIDEAKKAGKDPFDLFNPESPDFLGSKQVLAKYQMTMQESLSEVAENMRRGQTAKAPDNNASPGFWERSKKAVESLFGNASPPEAPAPSPEAMKAVESAFGQPKAPVSEPGMLDPNGPIIEPDMLDPNGPSLTPGKKTDLPKGKAPRLNQGTMSEAERQARISRDAPVAVEPKRPDETPAQYLERWNKAHR